MVCWVCVFALPSLFVAEDEAALTAEALLLAAMDFACKSRAVSRAAAAVRGGRPDLGEPDSAVDARFFAPPGGSGAVPTFGSSPSGLPDFAPAGGEPGGLAAVLVVFSFSVAGDFSDGSALGRLSGAFSFSSDCGSGCSCGAGSAGGAVTSSGLGGVSAVFFWQPEQPGKPSRQIKINHQRTWRDHLCRGETLITSR